MNKESVIELTRNLGIAAVVVGGAIIGMKYINRYLYLSAVKDYVRASTGLSVDKPVREKYKECFTIDRIIDPDCDGKSLVIGVNPDTSPINILSHQGIRHGEGGEIKHLTSFVRADNGLIYGFEGSTKLTLTKDKQTNKIMYSFETPEKTVVKEMDDIVVQKFKTISFRSKELDAIAELK
jgi:predicted Zn-dependent peptidase